MQGSLKPIALLQLQQHEVIMKRFITAIAALALFAAPASANPWRLSKPVVMTKTPAMALQKGRI